MTLSLEDAAEVYQVEGWGDGIFQITPAGTLGVRPTGPDGPLVDLQEVLDDLVADGIATPLVLRFPQILHGRVDRLNLAFKEALRQNGCKGNRYRGVFPIKVNQRRDVVQELTRAGRKHAYGLEVGSKAELVAALAMDPNRKSLLVVNGFKDRPFLEAACDALHFKDEVVIVMDEVGELEDLIPLLDNMEDRPTLGLRLKLRSKAPGKWALSGGDRAKFGLTIPEVLHAVARLEETGHLDRLQMLHFHIGSQLSDIRRIARGVREAARIHTELVRLGVPLRLLDCGGGMAVDYDGSGSSSPNSCNYTMEEYANTVVATVKDVCDQADVPMPDLISESGRAVVAHHAVLITDVIQHIPGLSLPPGEPEEDDPLPLQNLYATLEDLNAKNVFESFHDAVQYREDLQALFDLGHLRITAYGRAEQLFRTILARVRDLLEANEETESEEYVQAASMLSRKLVCNFSLFQSLPDIWGVKQQFPILPLQRLREETTEVATIADITCDSDGEIRQFIDLHGTKTELPVHALRAGEPYRLVMALVGAYQDALGDYHNLFGETEEAWVRVNPDGTWTAGHFADGSRVADMLEWVRYDAKDIRRRLRRRITRLRENGRIDWETARRLDRRLRSLLEGPTYLEGA